MTLVYIPAKQVDHAWRDGADVLAKACGPECTIDQLKYSIALGERTLVRMDNNGKTLGWGVIRVEQHPNMRVLFITNLVAPGAGFEKFFLELKKDAVALGCSRIRCAAQEAQARLYRMKIAMKPIYQVMETEV